MTDYIDPNDPTGRRYPAGVSRQKLPNGDTCLTPLDENTAMTAGLLPVEEVRPALADDEELGDPTPEVRADKVVLTYAKRRRSATDLAAEARARRDLLAELDALAARVDALEIQLQP